MDTLTAILVWVTLAGLVVGVAAEHLALRRRTAEPVRGRLAPHPAIKRTWP